MIASHRSASPTDESRRWIFPQTWASSIWIASRLRWKKGQVRSLCVAVARISFGIAMLKAAIPPSPSDAVGLPMESRAVLNQLTSRWLACLILVGASNVCLPEPIFAQRFRRFSRVQVSAETRIDWMYPVLRRSPAEPPEGLLDDYVSIQQRYVLYAPEPKTVFGRPMPLVLFISFQDTPVGWNVFGPTCAQRGVIFAEPMKAGNMTPTLKRVRIVLDVLDDLRRRYTIDPDRTYIAGYSGGGSTAALIATALPEYFGGVIASNTVVPIPQTASRLERVRSRLSVVMFAGGREPLALNVGRLDGPIFAKFGVRSQYRVFPGRGHAMPHAPAFDDAYAWLEQGVGQRRAAALKRASSRIAGAPTRQQQAKLFFDDANTLLDDETQVHLALAFMDDIAQRWGDLTEGREAKRIFEEYKSRSDRPWEKLAKRERLARTLFLAELYDREANGVGLSKLERGVVAKGAIRNWRIILSDSDDEALKARARQRIEPLQILADNKPGARQAPKTERERRER